MDHKRVIDITSRFSKQKILVIGDVMLDSYLWGNADRISPEAPVPVVAVERVEQNPGGSGNVALNLSALGAVVELVGVVGNDLEGSTLINLLRKKGIGCQGVITDSERPTTVKSRIIAQGQQMVRADREVDSDISVESETELFSFLSGAINQFSGIILEDYNKGVLNKKSISTILKMAQTNEIPVYVDPKKENFNAYKNVRLFKPNQSEFYTALSQEGKLVENGEKLRKKIKAEMVMVTQGEKGISLFMGDGYHEIPTKARHVHDVSGAGDTVISTFTLADLSGATPEEAAALANYAAGRVCEEVGVVPITQQMLAEMIEHHNSISIS